jgi:hypothetical protein
MATEREKTIRRRRHRRERIGKLKKQLKDVKNKGERNRLLELILRRDPLFLHRLEQQKTI